MLPEPVRSDFWSLRLVASFVRYPEWDASTEYSSLVDAVVEELKRIYCWTTAEEALIQ
jgi:hypothetical protein